MAQYKLPDKDVINGMLLSSINDVEDDLLTFADITSVGAGTPSVFEITDAKTDKKITFEDLFAMKEDLEILTNIIRDHPELHELYRCERVLRRLKS